jgi:hypothetical protein
MWREQSCEWRGGSSTLNLFDIICEKTNQRARSANGTHKMNSVDIFGSLIALVGAWLLYRSRKRVFDRKNAYGQEVFTSYGHKLVARSIDLIASFAATIVLLTGIMVLAIEHQYSWGWIVLAPAIWLFVVGYIPERNCCRPEIPR